jgi:hypothetical protein
MCLHFAACITCQQAVQMCGPEVFLPLRLHQMLNLSLNWTKLMYVSDIASSKNYCVFLACESLHLFLKQQDG